MLSFACIYCHITLLRPRANLNLTENGRRSIDDAVAAYRILTSHSRTGLAFVKQRTFTTTTLQNRKRTPERKCHTAKR